MDRRNALEAIEAIRTTVPEADQAGLDEDLLDEVTKRLGTVGKTVGATVVDNIVDPTEPKEAIIGKLETTFAGYQASVEQLNSRRSPSEQIEVTDEATVAEELEAYLTEDRLAYVTRAMEANPGLRYTLTAKPNVTVAAEEVVNGFRKFGEGQPYPTVVWPDVITQLVPEEVSGTDPENGNSVVFNLVPSQYDPVLYGTADTQKVGLGAQQKDSPFLKASVPLDVLVYLNTLRADGNKLVGGDIPELTYFRCYGMDAAKAKPVNRYVPVVFVGGGGRVYVYRSGVQYGGSGRALVG